MSEDPIARFAETYARAKAADPKGYDAFNFATVNEAGRPSSRMVLLKSVGPDGFVFYTNLTSRKGHEALGSKVAALCFYWPALYEQVRVEGRIEQVSDADANAYFASRERASQIGAWASLQSSTLDQRETLLARFADYERQFAGQPVPRPPHWSGLRVVPDMIEFWQGQPNRLHIRTEYRRDKASWSPRTLYP